MDDPWLSLGIVVGGALLTLMVPARYRNPILTDMGWQQINAESSPLGQRFGRSSYLAQFVLLSGIGPVLFLSGVALLLHGQGSGIRGAEVWLWIAAALVLLVTLAVSASVFLVGRPEVVLPVRLRGQPGFLADHRATTARPAGHEVTVMDVRPGPGDSYAPYLIATCRCGWVGDRQDSAAAAFAEAREHDANVIAEVARPVG
jgi:hypothetical protein